MLIRFMRLSEAQYSVPTFTYYVFLSLCKFEFEGLKRVQGISSVAILLKTFTHGGKHGSTILSKLSKLQRKATRVITCYKLCVVNYLKHSYKIDDN